MPCYRPIQGWLSRTKNPSGKRSVVFNKDAGFMDMEVKVPCGQCIGCRLEYSRQWAMRCLHEASLYDFNCFITLTYNDLYLPRDGSLHLDHFQLFMKRLRKAFPDRKIRFFHCGEYGEQNLRPHYHACIFNHDFDDKVLFKEKNGVRLYVSEKLQKLWPYGFSTIGDVTFESAAYVARYVVKKVTGKGKEEINPDTGLKPYERLVINPLDPLENEILRVAPEYTTMSRRPGIAADWFKAYKAEVYQNGSDSIVARGKEMKPPKFYDKLLEREHEDLYLKVKARRAKEGEKFKDNNNYDRLTVRETVKKASLNQLKRNLE